MAVVFPKLISDLLQSIAVFQPSDRLLHLKVDPCITSASDCNKTAFV